MTNWIPESIIYQINWRTMAAREPRNPFEAARETALDQSTFGYVRENLPVLQDLGVNVLYFMPIYPAGLIGSKGMGSPYAIRDFYGVSSEHGTESELVELVRAAHAAGMKVILDITPNHTSRDNAWVAEHEDYYVRDEQGEAVFDFDWCDTAKLNYHSPRLRRAMREVFQHWLSFMGTDADGRPDGFDGFRLDMAHMINDLSFWDDVIPVLRDSHPDRRLLFLAESYGFHNNWSLFGRGINAAYDDDYYKVCQYGYAVDCGGNSIVSISDDAVHNADFSELLVGFRSGGIAAAMELVLCGYEERAATADSPPWLARYTDNHDEGRGLHRFGAGAVRAAMRLAFLSPHTMPFILCGQEFGAVNRPTIHARLGTCDKGPRVIDGAHTRVEAGVEFQGNLLAPSLEERRDWFDFYKALISLRQATPELSRGDFELLDIGEESPSAERTVIAFERRFGASAVRCAVNLGPDSRRLGNAGLLAGAALYGALEGDRLPGFGAVVVCPVLI